MLAQTIPEENQIYTECFGSYCNQAFEQLDRVIITKHNLVNFESIFFLGGWLTSGHIYFRILAGALIGP